MPPRCSVTFGAFTFDPASGELTREGRTVRLQRQPSRLLQLLIARRGDVVTRDEIRQALWGGDTHVDFERSLNFCVAKLRSALGDEAAAPRFVETLPTRGYRFVANVRVEDAEGVEDLLAAGGTDDADTAGAAKGTKNSLAADSTDDADTARAAESPVGGWRWGLAAGLLLALTGIGIYAYRPAGSQPPKVVVVPFHNETGSDGFDRIAKGVSDAAVARLAAPERLPRLLVIGNAAGLQFSFKPRDMKALGDSLGAQFLVLGQLKKDDRQLRVVAHLIRVSDQTHLWAKTFDTATLDLPEQASIAEAIAGAVTDRVSAR